MKKQKNIYVKVGRLWFLVVRWEDGFPVELFPTGFTYEEVRKREPTFRVWDYSEIEVLQPFREILKKP